MFVIFILLSLGLFGQTRPFDGTFDEEEFQNRQEQEAIIPDSLDYDNYTQKGSSFKALFKGKPGKAIFWGVLIPGGGQIYNKRYWKFPIALGIEAAAIYTFGNLRSQHIELRKAYAQKLDDPDFVYLGLTAEQINNFRKQYQKWTEQAGVAMIVIHLVVAIESYIDRHLIDFDIDEDISFSVFPENQNLIGPTLNAGISYRF